MVCSSNIQLLYHLLLLFLCRHCEEVFSADAAIYPPNRNDIFFYSISQKDCFQLALSSLAMTTYQFLTTNLLTLFNSTSQLIISPPSPFSSLRRVQTTFLFTLVFPPPSSCSKILSWLHSPCTWSAADAWKTLIV